MKFDQAVNKILHENYFGGSPAEQQSGIRRHVGVAEDEQEHDFMSPDEVKQMQNMLNKGIEDRRGGKKKSNLQLVDPNQLSPAGREFVSKLDHAAEMYKQGSAIGGNAALREKARDFEDQAFQEAFGQTSMDYVAWDRGEGFGGSHVYRYPNVSGGENKAVGIPHDKDGFRLECQSSANKDDDIPEEVPLFPLDQWEVVNLFAKGSPEPILTRGKITQ